MGTIKSVQSLMGFTRANERTDVCGSCTHIEEIYPDRMPPWDKPYLMCKKGGFKVSKMAVCKQHEVRLSAVSGRYDD